MKIKRLKIKVFKDKHGTSVTYSEKEYYYDPEWVDTRVRRSINHNPKLRIVK